MSWAPGPGADLVENCLPMFEGWLKGEETLIGVYTAYDMCVMGEYAPELLPLIFKKYRRKQVQDLSLNQKILDLAKLGQCHEGYSVEALAQRYGVPHSNKGTVWRMEFASLKGIPINLWPAEALTYILDDAEVPALVHAKMPDPGPLAPQEARKEFCLRLISCWGVRTDAKKVALLEEQVQIDLDKAAATCKAAGIVREDGTRDVKAATEYMRRVNPKPRLTDKGGICLDKEACESTKDPVLMAYSLFGQAKTLMARVNDLKQGAVFPLQTKFNSILETSRTSTSKPAPPIVGVQLQNFPRKAGARECLVPRDGHVFLVCDLPLAELRSLSQNNIDLGYGSVMGEQLNAGKDLHAWFASKVTGLDYDYIMDRLDDPDVKSKRDRAKPANFGFPGGLGPDAFVDMAWFEYRLRFTRQEAVDLKELWLKAYPEMRKYLGRINRLLQGRERCNIETLRTKRKIARRTYNQAANFGFQELTATAASEAMCEVQDRCYTQRNSGLWESRVVMYQHDEIVTETPIEALHEAGIELSSVMAEVFSYYHPDVPALPCTGPTKDPRVVIPAAGYFYSKGLKPKWVEGKLAA